ncbi:hypothetical protein V8J88_15405 [Massilia sp. W12]|uniref:hypothetical protein n=1 Tax=Massilia sp. W12 TaxID=3126507 RepID=UPI0030D3B145
MSELLNLFLLPEEDVEDDDHDNFIKNDYFNLASANDAVTLIANPQPDFLF